MVQKSTKILIIGLGIGSLYKKECEKLNYTVITVDSDNLKNPNYLSIDAINDTYDLGIICTPNYLHYEHALKLSKICKSVLIEKPGVRNIQELYELYTTKAKIYIVKNNLYRRKKEYPNSNISTIKLNWLTKNRIPFPGSWFTNKELSFGGVSRDILPHLLCLMLKEINYDLFDLEKLFKGKSESNYNLSDITSTDYGTINQLGKYNVDDCLKDLQYRYKDKLYIININWKTNKEDNISIEYYNSLDQLVYKNHLGLCEDEAYGQMIKEIIDNQDNELFYNLNQMLDQFILSQISEY